MKPSNKKMNQKETLSLFNTSKSDGLKPLRRWVDQKTKDLSPQDIVVIKTLFELRELVEHLAPDNKTVDPNALPITVQSKGTKFADENFVGNIIIPQSGGQSMTRRTLLEGFNMVKRRKETLREISNDEETEYGGWFPAPLLDPDEQVTWLDRFIENRLGGKREDLFITWEVSEGKYRLDPWTGILEKVND
jgi:hypothetical protein